MLDIILYISFWNHIKKDITQVLTRDRLKFESTIRGGLKN